METAEDVFKEYLSTLETRDGNLGEPPKIYLGQIVKAWAFILSLTFVEIERWSV